MSKPILYGFNVSGPVRSVLLTVKAIGLEIEYKYINYKLNYKLTTNNLFNIIAEKLTYSRENT